LPGYADWASRVKTFNMMNRRHVSKKEKKDITPFDPALEQPKIKQQWQKLNKHF
jgi:hypothetical protein